MFSIFGGEVDQDELDVPNDSLDKILVPSS